MCIRVAVILSVCFSLGACATCRQHPAVCTAGVVVVGLAAGGIIAAQHHDHQATWTPNGRGIGPEVRP